MIHKRIVGGMIDRFDADNPVDEFRIMAMDVLDQFGLRVRRTRDEDELGVFYGFDGVVQEFLIFGRMSAADRIGLVMDMPRGIVRFDDDPIGLKPVEMEDARFAVIDPDDCVGVGAHGNSAVKMSSI
jgi:hypothetical protein